jgi:protein-S-isoprenylcysteine O-methyltransferase Ste14
MVAAAKYISGAPRWAVAVKRWTAWLSEDCLGGPRPWKLAWVINFQKAGTPFFLAALIGWYGNVSAAAWIYLALHGTYGLVWLGKDLTFPDRRWQKRVTIAGGINTFVFVLGWYWVFGWLLISRPPPHYPLPDPAWFALAIALCIAGVAQKIAADAQKYVALHERRRLITDGMFSIVRHPNYLGEMMIYASFALMVWRWLPVIVLALVWTLVFAVNMVLIEASLARYPEWPAYRARTWWLVPYVL